MTNLSITTAWNETAAFVAREGRLLFPVSLALITLPTVLLQAFTPAMIPGEEPKAGAWLLLLPLVLVSSVLGTLAISILALRPGTVVGDAIKAAARRLPAVLGAALLIALGAVVVLLPLMLLYDPKGGASGKPLIAALLLAASALFLFVSVRLMLVNPAAADARGGPLELIRRSWALTAGHFWKLLGFALLLVVLFLVVTLAVSSITGIVIVLAAGTPQPGGLPYLLILLVNAILNSIFVVYFTTMAARIYAQLSGQGTDIAT